MKITILCVGKIKESFYEQAVKEYCKRLSRYASVSIIEVADEKTPDNASSNEVLAIKRKEGERLSKHIRDDGYVYALAIEGKALDSVSFSEKMMKSLEAGGSHIYFVIGGSLGLSGEILSRADFLLSFSPMTFPHQLMRVILLEQIYRGFRIANHEPYHK